MRAVSTKLALSVIVLTFNEEENLAACLESVAGWVGEILVVDSGSTDDTVAIAGRYTDKIVEHPFESYALQRNWSQSRLPLQHEWVLHLDADERVTAELARSIAAFLTDGSAQRFDGAMFSRRTVFMGRWIRHGGHYPVYHRRLFRRGAGRCEDRLYDQHFLVNGPVQRLNGDLIDVLAPDLDVWSMKHLRWAAAEARELRREARGNSDQVQPRLFGGAMERRRWLRVRLFGGAPLFMRAFLYFVYRYVVRRGFLDGVEGLIFHVLHGFWYRFYVDAKLWEMEHRSHSIKETS